MSVISLVKGCPLFHEIYDHEVEKILRNCVVASFNQEDHIIKQGDNGTDICIILTGEADIIVDKNGEQKYIATLNAGDLFGEMVLLNETQRTANIVAKTNCDVLVFGQDAFYQLYNKSPEVFSLLALNLSRLITKRLKQANSIISNLSEELAKKAA